MFYEHLPEIKNENLLQVGTKNEHTPPGIALAMAEKLPEVKMIVFEDAKHSENAISRRNMQRQP